MENNTADSFVRQTPDLRLERHIRRLQARLESLQTLARQYTWVRMAVFFGGLGATVLTWLWFEPGAARLVGAISGLVFVVVILLHRRVEKAVQRYEIWLDLQKDQLARLELHWERLPHSPAIPDRSPLDIDLDLTGPRSLHQLLDLAVSVEGSQRLASWLTHPTPEVQQIAVRQAVVSELKPLRRFRQRLLLNLRLVTREPLSGARLVEWLELSVPPKLKWLLLAGAALSILDLVLLILFIQQKLPAYWIFTFIAYAAFYFFNAGPLKEFLEAVIGLDRELDKFAVLLRYLEGYPLYGKPQLLRFLAPFRDPQRTPSARLRKIKLVTVGVGIRSNPVLGILLNLFLPWDFLFAYLAARLRASAAEILPVWLECWYQLEALVSLANFADLHPQYTFPEITPETQPVFKAVGIRHPLIASGRSVANDFTIAGLGSLALITGSNMSGKSTFLKTIGINLCLAYAGGPVAAEKLQTLPLRVYTCMRISDSIADGFSYFYAEVKRLRGLLEELRQDGQAPVVYLIDEIYRGTNNRERLIGSQSFIRALIGAPGIGLIATHDLELSRLDEENDQVVNYHFRDEVADGQLIFDYRIRPGPSQTTNALKIMALEGLLID